MKSLVLIPWAETTWSIAGRLAGHTPLPLTDNGRAVVKSWADALAALGLSALFSSEEQTSVDTVHLVLNRVDVAWKVANGLSEVDAGLWDGLTTDELKRRYPKTFKKWRNDPSSVCPPEGEDLEDAYKRLEDAFDSIRRKAEDRCVGLVLGPLACGLVRCRLESADSSKTHSMALERPMIYQSTGENGWVPVGPLSDLAGAAKTGTAIDAGQENGRS